MTWAWRDRLLLGAPLIAGLALLGPVEDGPTICPFALSTGMACPGCGMTRAVSYLVRGDLGTAMGYHPLAPLVVVASLTGWAWFLLRRSGRVQPLPSRWVITALVGGGVMLLGVWVARALMGTLPPV